MRFFVAGATGYTGREVVRQARRAGHEVFAHVRPDSPVLDEWRQRFGAFGASVDATEWKPAAMQATLARLRPDVVFALLGTTKARARKAADRSDESYERVDYGLTRLLLDAVGTLTPPPRFVYLSAVGADRPPSGEYYRVRHRLERELAASGVPHVIARPSFITGEDRDESRPGERIAARVSDAVLGALAGLGAKRFAARYRSTDAATLAAALIRAVDGAGSDAVVLDPEHLR